MPSLLVIFGRDRGRHFPLSAGEEATFGRSTLLRNHLNDPSISREHVRFVNQPHNGQCMAIDMGSRNGTRINNKTLYRTQVLQDGDIIQLGYTLMVFVRVTFEAGDSIIAFLDECERLYADHLMRLRDHAALHSDRNDPRQRSAGSMSGTLHMGSVFGRK